MKMRLSGLPEYVLPTAATLASRPVSWPVKPRRYARPYGFFFCGMMTLARAMSSEKPMKSNSSVHQILQLLAQAVQVDQQRHHRRHQLDGRIGLPHGVARVGGHAIESQQGRQPFPVDRQARAVHAARPGGAGVEARIALPQALQVAQGGIDEGQQVVAERRGMRVLQVREVGHQGADVPLRQ